MAMSMGMASMGMAPPNGTQAAVAGMVADQVGNQVNSALLRWFPAVMSGLREYFNVNHRYVALKLAFLVAPVKPVKSSEYEMGDQDGARPLHVPDLYIPLMSYITYVIMLGLKLGLEGDSFHPEYLNQTATFAAVLIVLEVLCAKVAFYLAACNHVKMLDLMAHAGSKFVHLVLQVAFAAFLPPALQWGSFAVLAASCGWGVKQVLSAMDLPMHQPLVKYVIFGLGGSQVLLLYV